MKATTKYTIATAIAVFFHAVGLFGLLFLDKAFFIQATPFNLLLSAALLIWTQEDIGWGFRLFFITAFLVGVGVEIIGVNTGYLFGDYKYGAVLGPQIKGVPWLIGINWFIVIYCAGASIYQLMRWLESKIEKDRPAALGIFKKMALVADAATLAVIFDWILEPVAIQLGFWKWGGDGSIPFYNYLCWAMVSMVLLVVFHACRFKKANKFALHLLLVQVMFFVLLQTFMK